MSRSDSLGSVVSSDEDASMPVNEQGVEAVSVGLPRRPFPASRREPPSPSAAEDQQLHRELEARAREAAEDEVIGNFIAWFRDSVDEGRQIKPMQKYRKLATVLLCACMSLLGLDTPHARICLTRS